MRRRTKLCLTHSLRTKSYKTDAEEVLCKASYDAPLTRKTRLELPKKLLLLFFDVTGSKKMILGEMINFAKKVACIQFTFYGAFIQFTLTLYGLVKSQFLDLQKHDETSEQSSFRFEKPLLGSLLRKYRIMCPLTERYLKSVNLR